MKTALKMAAYRKSRLLIMDRDAAKVRKIHQTSKLAQTRWSIVFLKAIFLDFRPVINGSVSQMVDW